jgi:hypothetical protein
MGIYGAQGVEHLWLADPLLRMVKALSLAR